MVSRRTAEIIVKDYIADIKDPRCNYKREKFMQLSYSKWAAEEVLRTIRKRKDLSPIECVEYFTSKVDQYSLEHSKSSYIFSVAYDISMDIYDILLAAD